MTEETRPEVVRALGWDARLVKVGCPPEPRVKWQRAPKDSAPEESPM